MTPEKLKAAQRLKDRMDRLADFINTTDRMQHFCNGYGTHEKPETTAACKALLSADLKEQLAAAKAEFEAL